LYLLTDAVWNCLNTDDSSKIDQLVEQIISSLDFIKSKQKESQSENKSESESESESDTEKNRTCLNLLEMITASNRKVNKICLQTRQTLAIQCLEYLTSKEFDDEETVYTIVRCVCVYVFVV
jgi:hypothetical protein